MSGPDAMVASQGVDILHQRVTDYEIDANGQVVQSSIETAAQTVQAVVSQPTEEDTQRLEGRLSTGSIKLTLPSDVDVAADRGGRRDRIGYDGRVYEIVEVRDDRHPITGTRKLTAIADRLEGHGPLEAPGGATGYSEGYGSNYGSATDSDSPSYGEAYGSGYGDGSSDAYGSGYGTAYGD